MEKLSQAKCVWIGRLGRGYTVRARLAGEGMTRTLEIEWTPALPDPRRKAHCRLVMAAYRRWRASIIPELAEAVGIKSGNVLTVEPGVQS